MDIIQIAATLLYNDDIPEACGLYLTAVVQKFLDYHCQILGGEGNCAIYHPEITQFDHFL